MEEMNLCDKVYLVRGNWADWKRKADILKVAGDAIKKENETLASLLYDEAKEIVDMIGVRSYDE